MNKLYSLAFKRVLSNLGVQQLKPGTISQTLTTNKIQPITDYVLHRMPKDQLRDLIKNPCPITNIQTEENVSIRNSTKSLRSFYKMAEEKICIRCPFKQKCSEYGKQGKQHNENTIADLLVYMQALQNRSQLNNAIDANDRRALVGGYKLVDTVIATLQDLKQGGPQTLQFEKERLEHTQLYQKEKQKQGLEKKAIDSPTDTKIMGDNTISQAAKSNLQQNIQQQNLKIKNTTQFYQEYQQFANQINQTNKKNVQQNIKQNNKQNNKQNIKQNNKQIKNQQTQKQNYNQQRNPSYQKQQIERQPPRQPAKGKFQKTQFNQGNQRNPRNQRNQGNQNQGYQRNSRYQRNQGYQANQLNQKNKKFKNQTNQRNLRNQQFTNYSQQNFRSFDDENDIEQDGNANIRMGQRRQKNLSNSQQQMGGKNFNNAKTGYQPTNYNNEQPQKQQNRGLDRKMSGENRNQAQNQPFTYPKQKSEPNVKIHNHQVYKTWNPQFAQPSTQDVIRGRHRNDSVNPHASTDANINADANVVEPQPQPPKQGRGRRR